MTERLNVWAQDSVLRQVFKFYFIILFYVKSDRFTRLDPLNIKNTRMDSQSTKIVNKNKTLSCQCTVPSTTTTTHTLLRHNAYSREHQQSY